MVENYSYKLKGKEDISEFGLKPCKFCKPPFIAAYGSRTGQGDKAKGTAASVQCKGLTKKGYRCRHKTKIADGFCYQHRKQTSKNNAPIYNTTSTYRYSGSSSLCGAMTQSGKACRRKVKGGGRCYQH